MRLDVVLDKLPIGVVVLDGSLRVLAWNDFMALNTGRPAEDVVGKDLCACFPELPRAFIERRVRTVIALRTPSFSSHRQRPYLFELPHNRPATGGIDAMRQDITFSPIQGENGEVEAVSLAVMDVTDIAISERELATTHTQLREALARVEHLSQEDALTGIPNRRRTMEVLDAECKRVERYGTALTVALFDLDHFKRINDTYGHGAGDEVLRATTTRARQTLRETDLVGRWGGEEFLVILPGVGGASGVAALDRVRRSVAAAPVSCNGVEVPVTLTAGVTEARRGQSAMGVVEIADRALYAGKRAGRDRVVLASSETEVVAERAGERPQASR
jgi:diguanylate cyclase (GGDEF)-like protein